MGTLLLVPAPATIAGTGIPCCDDAWECAATVATGGVSCAVDQALEVVRKLIDAVFALRGTHTREYEETVAAVEPDLVESLQGAVASAHAAVDAAQRSAAMARKMAGEDRLAFTRSRSLTAGPPVTVVPRSANNGLTNAHAASGAGAGATRTSTALTSLSIDPPVSHLIPEINPDAADWMKQQAHLVELCAVEASAAAHSLDRLMVVAKEYSKTRVTKVGKVFQDRFLNPVDEVLRLLKSGLSLNNPLEIATFATQISRVVYAIRITYEQEIGTEVRSLGTVVQEAAAPSLNATQEAWAAAGRAADIVARMQRAQKLTTLAARQALVLQPGAGNVRRSGLTKVATRSAPILSRFLPAARNVTLKLAALTPDLDRLAGAAVVNLAPVRARLAADLDARFLGKDPGARKRALQELLAESRRRFGSDQKKLQSVETLLTSEALARGVN